MKVFLFSLLALIPINAQGYGFVISNRTTTADPTLMNTLADSLQAAVNSTLFPTGEFGTEGFLKAMGNTGASSTRGMGIDTVSRYETIGITAQGGMATGGPNATDPPPNSLPSVGISAQGSLAFSFPGKTLGIKKFSSAAGDRLFLGANFMHLTVNAKNLSLDFLTLGAHGFYLLGAQSKRESLLRFEGFKLSSGLQYSQQTVNYKQSLNFSRSASGYTMGFSSVLNAGVKSSVFTVPIEMNAGLTFLRFLTLYGSLGFGMNYGSSKLTGRVSGPVSATDDSNGSAVFSGTGTLDVSATKEPRPAFIDYWTTTGIQLNLWSFKMFLQNSKSSQRISSTLMGIRATW